jgi:hypothetical protein
VGPALLGLGQALAQLHVFARPGLVGPLLGLHLLAVADVRLHLGRLRGRQVGGLAQVLAEARDGLVGRLFCS